MSGKFKPGDKVRYAVGSEINFVIGPHPGNPHMFWAIRPSDPQPILHVESDYELVPEPRKIEGWVVVNRKSGRNSLFPDRTEAEKFSYKDCETVVYVSGTEGIEP